MKLFANLINIKSSKIGQYPGDTEGDSIILTSEGSAGKGETQQQYGMAGFISNPAKNVKGVRFRIGSLDIVIGALNYKVALPENPGETKVYSTDAEGDENGATIYRNDGIQEINGNQDFAVRFLEMEAAYNELKTDFNDLITAYNTHIHVTTATIGLAPVGVISPTTSTGTPSTADMSDAKVDTVKLPELGEVYP